MNQTLKNRVRVPAVMAVIGGGITVEVIVVQGLTAAIGVGVVTVLATAGYWWVGGRDSDVGAIIRQQPDERQLSIHLEALAFAAIACIAVAIGGAFVEIARRQSALPFDIVACTGGFTFLASLAWLRRRL